MSDMISQLRDKGLSFSETDKNILEKFMENEEIKEYLQNQIKNSQGLLTKKGVFSLIEQAFPEKIQQVHEEVKKENNFSEWAREKVNSALQYLTLGKEYRQTATELLVDVIKEEHAIKTIRDDREAEMWIYQKGIYVPFGRSFVKETLRKWLGEAYTTQRANQVLEKLETDTYVESSQFFFQHNKEEIPVKNGILNLKTKELRDFNPDEIFFFKLPVEYDPKAECPNWINHLKTVLKHPEEDEKVMAEVFGHALLPEYKFSKAVMLTGGGNNGKSLTLGILKELLGPENVTNISLERIEKEPFSIAELFGKLANISGDINSMGLSQTARFKELTGGDFTSAQRKFKPDITFQNHAKFFFACNQLPRSYDQSYGLKRRWILLEFPYKFVPYDEYEQLKEDEKKWCKIADDSIKEKIHQELTGILNWAIEGLHRLLSQREFSTSLSTEEQWKEWQRKADSFIAFLEDHIDMTYDYQNDFITKDDLRETYAAYCGRNHLKTQSAKAMKVTLEEHGFTEVQKKITLDTEESSSVKRVYYGMKWKELSDCSQGSRVSQGFKLHRENLNSDMGVTPPVNPVNPVNSDNNNLNHNYDLSDITQEVND